MNYETAKRLWDPVEAAFEALRKKYPEAAKDLYALEDLAVDTSVDWEDAAHEETLNGHGTISEGSFGTAGSEGGVTLRQLAMQGGLDARVHVGLAGAAAPVVSAVLVNGLVVLDLPEAGAFGADSLCAGTPQRYRLSLIEAAIEALRGDLAEAEA